MWASEVYGSGFNELYDIMSIESNSNNDKVIIRRVIDNSIWEIQLNHFKYEGQFDVDCRIPIYKNFWSSFSSTYMATVLDTKTNQSILKIGYTTKTVEQRFSRMNNRYQLCPGHQIFKCESIKHAKNNEKCALNFLRRCGFSVKLDDPMFGDYNDTEVFSLPPFESDKILKTLKKILSNPLNQLPV